MTNNKCPAAKFKTPVAQKTRAARSVRKQPLETGQLWLVADMHFRVGLIGKLLVHYKLAKPNAVRIPNSVSGKKTVEEYLKKNKAVLLEASAPLPSGALQGSTRISRA